MKLTILGSGTTITTKERSAPAYLLQTANKLILIDSGEGTKRRIVEANKSFLDIDYIFYTHTHIDHINELPAILWGNRWNNPPRTKELVIFGPKGFKRFFKRMLKAFLPQFFKNSSFKTEVKELKDEKIKIDDFTVQMISLDRQKDTLVKNSIGYRIEYRGKSIVFSGDVGYNKDIIKLAKNTDLFLLESASPIPTNGHLTPSQAGELAAEAEVKKLVLTHFYPAVERIDILNEARKRFNGEIVLARDLMEIEI